MPLSCCRWPLRGLGSEGLPHRHRLLLPPQAVHRQPGAHRPLQGEHTDLFHQEWGGYMKKGLKFSFTQGENTIFLK